LDSTFWLDSTLKIYHGRGGSGRSVGRKVVR